MNVTPPEVPTPGIAGGENENGEAIRHLCQLPEDDVRMPAYCSSGFFVRPTAFR